MSYRGSTVAKHEYYETKLRHTSAVAICKPRRASLLALRPQHISWLFRYNIKTIRTLSYIFPLFDSVLPAISRSHNGSCYHFIHKFEKLNSVTVFWANESFTGSVSNSISSMRRSVSSLDETLRRELKIRRVVEYFRQTSRCFIW